MRTDGPERGWLLSKSGRLADWVPPRSCLSGTAGA